MRKVIEFPDPILTVPCEAVTVFDSSIGSLVKEMNEVMAAKSFAGLAANQIGDKRRIVTLWANGLPPFCMVNPVITEFSESKAVMWEGCGSFTTNEFLPKSAVFYGGFWCIQTLRPAEVLVKYQDERGTFRSLRVKHSEGQLCQAIQHEIDHIDGIVFTSRVP
jgi:peptide deformylase